MSILIIHTVIYAVDTLFHLFYWITVDHRSLTKPHQREPCPTNQDQYTLIEQSIKPIIKSVICQ